MPLAKQIAHNQIVLAIILPEKRIAKIEALLDKQAANDWRDHQRILLIKIPDQYINSIPHLQQSIKSQFEGFGLDFSNQNIRYMISNELSFDQRIQKKLHIPAETDIDIVSFKMLEILLKRRLNDYGLHWLRVVEAEIRKWQFDTIGETDIDNWLKQFDQIGKDKRWVGERLLRNFKVFSVDQFVSALQGGSGMGIKGAQICIIRYENGKSSDSISTILRKKLSHLIGAGEIEEYRTFLETSNNTTCHVFEDGVFTGIEISDLICSLFGVDGFTKCAPLTVPSRMKNCKTFIQFAIGTDIGLHHVRETIKKLDLAVEVYAHHEIKTLTDSGLVNLMGGTLYIKDDDGKNILQSAEKDINPQAFLDSIWGDQRADAIAFCRQLGLELFTAYQINKGKNWTTERLKDCALGAGNIALLFSFSHSLPKSTLPVFWCHGTIKNQRGKSHVWKPLFPSAHPK